MLQVILSFNVALLVTHIDTFPWQYFQNVSQKQTFSSGLMSRNHWFHKITESDGFLENAAVTGWCFSRVLVRLQVLVYLEPSRAFTIKRFYVLNYFRQKAPSYISYWFLNTPLTRNIGFVWNISEISSRIDTS